MRLVPVFVVLSVLLVLILYYLPTKLDLSFGQILTTEYINKEIQKKPNDSETSDKAVPSLLPTKLDLSFGQILTTEYINKEIQKKPNDSETSDKAVPSLLPLRAIYKEGLNYRGSKFFTNFEWSGSECPNRTILTVTSGGNTCNQVWEYLSVRAVSALYDFQPYVPDEILDETEDIFQPLIIPPLSQLHEECRKTTLKILKQDLSSFKGTFDVQMLVLDIYSARYDEVIAWGLENVRKELKFKPQDKAAAMNTLRKIKAESKYSKNDNVTFVGMHYRGGDYITLLQDYPNFKGPPDANFYSRAMNYFNKTTENPIFIMITTDDTFREANKDILKDVTWSRAGASKAEDLSLLSFCNHTILSYGTFGVTAAILNGGTTIVFDLELPLDHRGPTIATGIAKILPHWLAMK